MNEAYRDGTSRYGEYIDRLRSGVLGELFSRYIGSMVADFHRTLLKGGVFLYPPTNDNAEGKLRCFATNPVAMLAEQAGGIALDGSKRIMDVEPTNYISARLCGAAGSKCPISNASFSRVARISAFPQGFVDQLLGGVQLLEITKESSAPSSSAISLGGFAANLVRFLGNFVGLFHKRRPRSIRW